MNIPADSILVILLLAGIVITVLVLHYTANIRENTSYVKGGTPVSWGAWPPNLYGVDKSRPRSTQQEQIGSLMRKWAGFQDIQTDILSDFSVAQAVNPQPEHHYSEFL